ncbi:DegQ family serine endoprotease [Uliginosibacterium sp. H1]|uniref:DegQ family serine endoprotease n=1 Tax=Uliginosibacterium sp. H1 TaxID=3114757 RepID=UPI002E16EA94|nr:DegQ family serine endoprotease [Uliginosibacterium sp. H1]
MNAATVTPRKTLVALLVTGLVVSGGMVAYHSVDASPITPAAAATMPAPAAPAANQAASNAPLAGAPDFAGVVQRYGPAVVNITVTSKAQMAQQDDEDDAPAVATPQDPFGNDPFFEYFRRFMTPDGRPRDPQAEMPQHGLGSGFIISSDGLILTNAHVVRNATEVTVKLTDRREFRAKVLGSDPKTDVAVIRIDAKDLPTVKLAAADDLRVGEWVLAIGSPFGFENSVSAGVISAKGRSLPDENYVPFIQTDVAVNPGNSGGPLFNGRGEVVGINSQIYSRSGGYQGLSFAIPVDVAMRVQQQIVASGHATHARLGVSVQEVNQSLADSFKLDRPAGALVSGVDAKGPAAKAGLKEGDVIRSVNGQPIVGSGDLPALIGASSPGQKVTLDVWRDGKAMKLDATLAALDEGKAAKQAAAEPQKGRLGLALRPLQPDERQDGQSGGLVVENVSGAAARAGIEPGDVLLSVNGAPVRSAEQVRNIVADAGKSVALLIQRGDARIFVPVRIG